MTEPTGTTRPDVMTLGELRRIVAEHVDVPDDTPVVYADNDHPFEHWTRAQPLAAAELGMVDDSGSARLYDTAAQRAANPDSEIPPAPGDAHLVLVLWPSTWAT